MKVSRPALFDF